MFNNIKYCISIWDVYGTPLNRIIHEDSSSYSYELVCVCVCDRDDGDGCFVSFTQHFISLFGVFFSGEISNEQIDACRIHVARTYGSARPNEKVSK